MAPTPTRQLVLGVDTHRDLHVAVLLDRLGRKLATASFGTTDAANAAPDADTIVFAPAVRGATVNLALFQNYSSSLPALLQPAGPSALIVITPTRFPGGNVACTQGTCINDEVATGTPA